MRESWRKPNPSYPPFTKKREFPSLAKRGRGDFWRDGFS